MPGGFHKTAKPFPCSRGKGSLPVVDHIKQTKVYY